MSQGDSCTAKIVQQVSEKRFSVRLSARWLAYFPCLIRRSKCELPSRNMVAIANKVVSIAQSCFPSLIDIN